LPDKFLMKNECVDASETDMLITGNTQTSRSVGVSF
jgi:hypothetical protein